MGWMSPNSLNHLPFARQLNDIFFPLNLQICIYLKHFKYCLLLTSTLYQYNSIRPMIRSSYNYYSHFTDGKVKSEDSNPPHFSAAELGLNLLGQLTLSLCSWQLSGRVLGGAGLCDCGCVGVKGDVQPSDSPGPSPTLCSPAQPSRLSLTKARVTQDLATLSPLPSLQASCPHNFSLQAACPHNFQVSPDPNPRPNLISWTLRHT